MAFSEMDYMNVGGGNITHESVSNVSGYSKTLDFTPKYIMIVAKKSSTILGCIYNTDISTTTYVRYYPTTGVTTVNLNDSNYTGLLSVSGKTFTMTNETYDNLEYIAIG